MNFYTSIELALWVIAISSLVRTGILIKGNMWKKRNLEKTKCALR